MITFIFGVSLIPRIEKKLIKIGEDVLNLPDGHERTIFFLIYLTHWVVDRWSTPTLESQIEMIQT